MVEIGACALQIDVRRCKDCGTCEGLLPGFKSKQRGMLLISANNMEKESVLQAISCVMGHCPELAISILPYPISSLCLETLLERVSSTPASEDLPPSNNAD